MFPLVIMAAGMSSRYQKSKQLECLIDNYNLVDFLQSLFYKTISAIKIVAVDNCK